MFKILHEEIFRVKTFFVGTASLVSVVNIYMVENIGFRQLNFCSRLRLRKYFNKKFLNYGRPVLCTFSSS